MKKNSTNRPNLIGSECVSKKHTSRGCEMGVDTCMCAVVLCIFSHRALHSCISPSVLNLTVLYRQRYGQREVKKTASRGWVYRLVCVCVCVCVCVRWGVSVYVCVCEYLPSCPLVQESMHLFKC